MSRYQIKCEDMSLDRVVQECEAHGMLIAEVLLHINDNWRVVATWNGEVWKITEVYRR